ncbi:MAG: hypothetical protein JKY95_02250, partial [Planctomycetaceae bacterium]|nr:hypothetical protein [Planctomycetaceae bacterium]
GGGTAAFSQDLIDRYFPVRNFDRMFGNMAGGGIQVSFGFTNEDGSGVEVSGWYGGESNDVFQRGGIPRRTYVPSLDPFSILGNDPLYLTELNALNGSLSINNGAGIADRVAFDTLFEMQVSQQAWGTGIQFLRPAVARGSWYTVRPIVGLKYVNIYEKFAFRGLDSGAEYEFINFTNTDPQQEIQTIFESESGFSATNNTGGELGFEGRPLIDTFNDGTTDFLAANNYPVDAFETNPYETQIGASNQVNAAGPEIGYRVDLGEGKNTKMWFVATAGLTATKETLNLQGFGVYNHFLNNVDPDNDISTPDGGELGTGVGAIPDADTVFNDESDTTHVSPLLDLTANFEFRLFEYIPMLNRIEFLEQARFKTSYGFLYVGNISRPQESVDYSTFPINPSLNPNRSGWTMQKWTFGLDWEY